LQFQLYFCLWLKFCADVQSACVECHLSKMITAAFDDIPVIMVPMPAKYSIDQEAQFFGLFQ
jgi:hypothetical protein